MTRFVCISDTHTLHDQVKLPEGDVLLHCGDLTWTGRESEYEKFRSFIRHIKNTTDFQKIIIILGNHDFTENPSFFKVKHLLEEHRVVLLHDSSITIGNKLIHGTPWTPTFYNWAWMADDNEDIDKYFARIPIATNILLSHGPPYSILDKAVEGESVGSKMLYNRVKQLPELKYHCFGHIHEGYGIEKIDDVTFMNCSVVNRKYEVVNKPMVFDL